ncbi:YraN family protein [Desulfosporosinus sp. FKB]|uniref:YraN family protein n=1 Tax=Desulfosporosinus sp. FKB TaxID=1969835 RepID=UPI000B49785B|nr:YraN family protein [Desulfosporosinus sp. FKB]
MGIKKNSLGRSGEELAVHSVTASGLRVLKRNYRCPKGEMDIIAEDQETLVFIEVRTRSSAYRGWGEESITSQKAQRLRSIAAYYILQQGYANWPEMRIDVIAIRWLGDNPDLMWIKGAL